MADARGLALEAAHRVQGQPTGSDEQQTDESGEQGDVELGTGATLDDEADVDLDRQDRTDHGRDQRKGDVSGEQADDEQQATDAFCDHINMSTIGIWNKRGVMDEEFLFWDNQTFNQQIGLS